MGERAVTSWARTAGGSRCSGDPNGACFGASGSQGYLVYKKKPTPLHDHRTLGIGLRQGSTGPYIRLKHEGSDQLGQDRWGEQVQRRPKRRLVCGLGIGIHNLPHKR